MNPQVEAEEEDSDYDAFAAWRPAGVSVDDNMQDELDSEQEDDQFAKWRSDNQSSDQVESEQEGSLLVDSLKDYLKQFGKESLIGLGGTWGDLAELAGLSGLNESQQARYDDQAELLGRIKKGHKPSFSELRSLAMDEEIAPGAVLLPTSKNLKQANDYIGGPGEPETEAGKYGKRQGSLLGAGLSFGQVNPAPALLAGAAGQAIEQAGGGPLLQTASEIATLLLTQGKGSGKTLVGSSKKEVAEKISKLRQAGYTEEEITLAINAASKGKKGGIKASKGSKTEKAFEQFSEHTDEMVNDILTKQIPGYEKGSKHIHELASEAYGQVVEEASKLNIKNLDPFVDSMQRTFKDIKKSIGHNSEAKSFVNELNEHTLDIISNPTAENMIDFYKRLNGLGRWVGRNQKDRIISNVKQSIKDTFRTEGKEGIQLADKFEKVNEGIQKAYMAEDVSKIMQKATSQDGIDYKKLYKSFDKQDNMKLFQDVLGSDQARNLHLLAKTGKEIKDFDKAYKATSLIAGTPTSLATNVGYLIYSGNWPVLAGLKGMEAVSRKLAEKSLTDPKFQNLLVRGLHAVKNESPKSFKSASQAMQAYLDDQKININLTKD